ncbi:MAG: GreA/GreB family elongation factor [Candidatus Buchananbacteria bacterium]
MQVPIRKPGKYTFAKVDLNLTEEKFQELQAQLVSLKKNQPILAAEVKRLAEMGDLSENVGYSIAKGKLRGLNQKIIDLQDQINRVVIIKPQGNNETVQLGNKVYLNRQGQDLVFLILGSQETDPQKGIISHQSPIGAALMGRRVGETAKVKLKDREIEYKITKIE